MLRSRRGPVLWLFALANVVLYASAGLIWRLSWRAQLVAWPISIGVVTWLMVWGRSRAQAAAPPVPDAGQLLAVELPASARTADLSAAAPVRAAGSVTVRDAIRNSRQARPASGRRPEADRQALLAGQSFRVTAARRIGGRWGDGRLEIGGQPLAVTWQRAVLPLAGPRRARGARSLPLAPSSRIVLSRPVDEARDRFPWMNDWLFTVVTIRTRDGQQTLAIPTIDVPLVHAALELANAEESVG